MEGETMTKRRMPRSSKNEGRGAVRFGLKSPINSSRNCPQAKIAFRGRKLARAAADRINGRNGAEIMRHYKCDHCDWWHLATIKK